MAEPTGRVLVVIPTYQERDNLGPVVARLHAAVPDADVLVVDDASPDGTGELADEMAAADPRVKVLHRTGKQGLGAAYLAGFATALRDDYQVVVEMDADGSHPPEDLPALIAALEDADVVLGSRYVPGGIVRNWPARRQLISRAGNLYSRLALGVPIKDITAGFRVFRRQVLEEFDLDQVASQGYCFQIDMAWRAVLAGFRVREVPITFTERQRGSSKMDTAIVVEAFWRVACWGAGRLLRRTPTVLRDRQATPPPTERPSGPAGDEAVSDGPVRT
jgi:dolichol-phosphate mannosyltransferase